MLKNNKGITLAALVITIIVLIILASVATASGKDAINYVKFNNAKAQFQTMQAQANSWYEEAKNNTDILNYGLDLSKCDATKKDQTLNGRDPTGYRYFNSDYIKNDFDIDGISYDFLINVSNGTVLLYGGITYKDKPYYSAEDFGINNIEYTELSGEITFDTAVEDSKIRIYDITLPKDVSKYYIQYKNNKKGDTYWTTLTSDKKEAYTYTNAEGISVTDNNAWYIPIEVQDINNTSNDESYIPYIEGASNEQEIANYTIKIITESITIASEAINVIKKESMGGYESYVGKTMEKKTTLRDTNEDKIVVPAGFTISTDSRVNSSEALIKNGIVVVAPDGSEFVWVPVEDVTTMYGTDKNRNKLGKLYNFTDSNVANNTADNWTETNGVMSWTNNGSVSSSKSYREPDYLSNTEVGDASTRSVRGISLLKSIVRLSGTNSEILKEWQTNLKNEFNDMIGSVTINKGFYVGRYETSLNGTKAQSKKGKNSATAAENSANTWYGLYQKEKEYSSKNTLTNAVGSSMIWGCQYDQMMIWMQKNGYNVASVTPKTGLSKNTGKNASSVGTTGTVETDKLNNVYDLLGNGFEWTLEAQGTSYRVYRGGYYSSTSNIPPRNKEGHYPYNLQSNDSSRLSLYVK